MLARLGGAALQLRPDPSGKDNAFAVGQPFERIDAGRKRALAHGLAAVGRDDVKLRAGVLLALLLALGQEGDAVTAGRPGRLAVFVAAAGQLARRGLVGRQQPQAGLRLVVFQRACGDRADRALAVRCQRDLANTLKGPKVGGVQGS
ncbi:hypothetical protein ACVBEH_09420 [Roseateles sp. GG27B]